MTSRPERPIALFDMDGTLADYDGRLQRDLDRIAGPNDPPFNVYSNDPTPEYITRRRHVITSQAEWWENLEPLQSGFEIFDLCDELGFKNIILTKGPSSKPFAWSEKVNWCNIHLGSLPNGITLTHDKSLVYGKLLVDDWPEYIERWLKWRPRGLAIMPTNPRNIGFTHPNVIPYSGNVLELQAIRERLTLHRG